MPSSSFRGVTWSKRERKWRVQVCHEGKIKYGGQYAYADEEDAARAYDALARKLKGSSAKPNFPRGSEASAATQHPRASLAEAAVSSGGGVATPCCAEPPAKRARHVMSAEGEEDSSIYLWENRNRLWAEIAARNAQIAALVARANAKRDARLTAAAQAGQLAAAGAII